MNEHVEKLLAAYYDGELSGRSLEQVEIHLKVCEACRAELENLAALGAMLQESHEMEPRLSSEQFAAQVGLRLPREQSRPPLRRGLTGMWYAVPIFLLFAWVFADAVLTQTAWLNVAVDLGLWRLPAGFSPGASSLNPLAIRLGISAATGLGLLAWAASWWMRASGRNSSGRTE